MEMTTYPLYKEQIINENEVIFDKRKNFIEANTFEVQLDHLKKDCIVPVFSKDNESTISHFEFIKHSVDVLKNILPNTVDLTPEIRVSHAIKGRTPQALGKPAKELLEHEKTIYYERMAFVIEIPEISQIINGNRLNLAIGGVRAYNLENLYSRKSIEKFKLFIGFQNTVCTNLCISTDGLKADIRISSIHELHSKILGLINSYQRKEHLEELEDLINYSIDENQFAYLIGKMKMYQYLPKKEKKNIFPLSITDSQITTIVRDYYTDANFSKDNDMINLWKLYNLFTEANKSSYIDNNLERNKNVYEFINHLRNKLKNNQDDWFLNKNNITYSTT